MVGSWEQNNEKDILGALLGMREVESEKKERKGVLKHVDLM